MKINIEAAKNYTVDEVPCGTVFTATASRAKGKDLEIHYYMKIDHSNGVLLRKPATATNRYAVNLATGQIRTFHMNEEVRSILYNAALEL